MTTDDRLDLIQSKIRDIPDFPKPGILFKDITPLLADHAAFTACLSLFEERYRSLAPDAVVGIESRGFIFGAALAARLGAAFVPARKPGKLPWKTERVEYSLEYGTDSLEMHVDAVEAGEKVVIIDDLMATGGTAAATKALVEKLGGVVIGAGFVIELAFLGGGKKLGGLETYALARF